MNSAINIAIDKVNVISLQIKFTDIDKNKVIC